MIATDKLASSASVRILTVGNKSLVLVGECALFRLSH